MENSPVEVTRSYDDFLTVELCYKIIVVGTSGVGKTSFIRRLVDGNFDESHRVTLSGDYFRLYYSLNDVKSKIQLWDTCGLEQYISFNALFYKESHCVLAFFDTSNKKSFDDCPMWISEVRENTPINTPIFLVGSKIDLPSFPTLQDDVNNLVESKELHGYMEISSKTGENVEAIMEKVLNYLYMSSVLMKKPTGRESLGVILGKKIDGKMKKGCSCQLKIIRRI